LYLCLLLHLPFCSAQDTVGIAWLHVAAPVGIRGFSIRPLWLHASVSLKESRPGRSVDVEATIVLGLLSGRAQWRTNRLADQHGCSIEQQGLW
jgi:hypothetical protein